MRSPCDLQLSTSSCHGCGRGSPFGPRSLLLLLVFVVTGFVVFVLRTSTVRSPATAYSGGFMTPVTSPPNISALDLAVPEEVRLERALKKAAMVDKTVILTIVNDAWTRTGSVLDIFLESIRTGERTSRYLDHLLIVAMDQKAYTRCQALHDNCFALKTEGVDFSDQKDFMSDGYLKLVWRKVDFQRIVLEMGYNFIFSDADIVWLRDPLPHLSTMNADVQLSCDQYRSTTSAAPNVGFHFARSNNRTIGFYKFWHSSRLKHPAQKTQEVLNSIKNGLFVRTVGLTIGYLSTAYFGGLCEPSKDFTKVCTMHVNCCVGLGNKINDLHLILDDWRRFLSRPPSVGASNFATWSVPRSCRL